MTDALAPWANLGMLVVIGGVVTLVLAAVAGASPGAAASPRAASPGAAASPRAASPGVASPGVASPGAAGPPGRVPVPQLVGALGAVAAFVAGLAVAAVAVVAPERWWFALLGWGVWIAGELVVFGLLAVLHSRQRRRAAP